MDAETRDRIETIFVECVVALFEAFGVRAEPVPPSDKRSAATRSTLSIIGFAGKPLRGSLVFTADEALLLRTYTHCLDADADVPDLDASDWSAELANQLLGRIQNKLQVQGIVLYTSTPTSLSGLVRSMRAVTIFWRCDSRPSQSPKSHSIRRKRTPSFAARAR